LDADTLRFTLAQPDLNLYRDDPAIALAAGDVVSFAGYSLAGDLSDACRPVVNAENKSPLRFELVIENVQPDHLDLHTLADTPDLRGFHPDGCSVFGAVAEIRPARNQPWLVFENETVRGRVGEDGKFDV